MKSLRTGFFYQFKRLQCFPPVAKNRQSASLFSEPPCTSRETPLCGVLERFLLHLRRLPLGGSGVGSGLGVGGGKATHACMLWSARFLCSSIRVSLDRSNQNEASTLRKCPSWAHFLFVTKVSAAAHRRSHDAPSAVRLWRRLHDRHHERPQHRPHLTHGLRQSCAPDHDRRPRACQLCGRLLACEFLRVQDAQRRRDARLVAHRLHPHLGAQRDGGGAVRHRRRPRLHGRL